MRKRIIRELKNIAFSDYTDYVRVEIDEEGEHIVIADTGMLKTSLRRGIAGIKLGTKGIEVKLYDKMKALEMLGKIVGIFDYVKDNTEQLKALERMLCSGLEDCNNELSRDIVDYDMDYDSELSDC